MLPRDPAGTIAPTSADRGPACAPLPGAPSTRPRASARPGRPPAPRPAGRRTRRSLRPPPSSPRSRLERIAPDPAALRKRETARSPSCPAGRAGGSPPSLGSRARGARDCAQVVLHGRRHPVEWLVERIERRACFALELQPFTEAALVRHRLLAPRCRDHPLVLRKRLFDEERPREVELTGRPAELPAQRASVAHHRADLRRRPGLPEGGHIERQPERRPAVRDDADPAGFGFRGARLALLQVRRGHGETRRRRGLATPVGSVTLAAPRLIQRGAV